MENGKWALSGVAQLPLSVHAIVIGFMTWALYQYRSSERPCPGIPVLTLKLHGWKSLLPMKWVWILEGRRMLAEGANEYPSCFQVKTGSGYKIIVPNRFAEELKNHANLNFNEAFTKEFFINYPGFDGPRQGLQDETFLQEVIRIKLTQRLGLVTSDLVEETAASFQETWGESSDWQTRLVKDDILNIVARLSSRVFLGKELCRNARWLEISKNYTIDLFLASAQLRLCPGFLRPLLYWLIPACRRLRHETRDARQIIQPEVNKTIEEMERIGQEEETSYKTTNTIGWMVELSKGRPVDFVAGQLSLSMAAIHTTSEATTRCIMWLCEHPNIVEPLRKEMIAVLTQNGWSKVTLYKMKLLDSFLKEVQRLDGLTMASMNRSIKKDVLLSDGTKLPAGERLMVLNDKNMDETMYTSPNEFDAARFMRMRERPGEENHHQFVTTSMQHMDFGHGQHACPGRFFAANEIKIALCFLLLQYDIRYVPNQDCVRDIEFETVRSVHPKLKVQVRKRHEEIDLISPMQNK